MLGDAGVTVVPLPPKSPNLNAYAERFVRSIRRECLDMIVPLSEQHLRRVVTEYVTHYNTERDHQGIGNALISETAKTANDNGAARRRKRIGGLLSYYHRDVA